MHPWGMVQLSDAEAAVYLWSIIVKTHTAMADWKSQQVTQVMSVLLVESFQYKAGELWHYLELHNQHLLSHYKTCLEILC